MLASTWTRLPNPCTAPVDHPCRWSRLSVQSLLHQPPPTPTHYPPASRSASFDKFNLKYNPFGQSRLREIFIKQVGMLCCAALC